MTRSQFGKKFEEYLKNLTLEQRDDHQRELLSFAEKAVQL